MPVGHHFALGIDEAVRHRSLLIWMKALMPEQHSLLLRQRIAESGRLKLALGWVLLYGIIMSGLTLFAFSQLFHFVLQ